MPKLKLQAQILLDAVFEAERSQYPPTMLPKLLKREKQVREAIEEKGTDRVQVMCMTNLGQVTMGVILDTFVSKSADYGVKELLLHSSGDGWNWTTAVSQ